MYRILILFTILHFTQVLGQELNDNCSDAIQLCPGVTVSGNNINATATSCGGCEDAYNWCFPHENSVWYKFVTNPTGGDMTFDLSNIVYETSATQEQSIEVGIYSYSTPCVSTTFTGVFTASCNLTGSAGATNINETVNGLLPNTTYYLVVDGYMLGALPDPGEASFDLTISGLAVERPTPSISISTSSTNICIGDTVTLTASKTDCMLDSLYYWSIDGTLVAVTSVDTFQTNAIQDGNYVSVYSICDTLCTLQTPSDSIQFNVLDLVVEAGNDTEIKEGESTQLNGTGNGLAMIYEWTPASSLSNPYVANPIATPSMTTMYFLAITDTITGCINYDSVTVTVALNLKIPDTFTPNGDGINDTWEIVTIDQYPDCEVLIYNRWGTVVFQSNGYPESKWWDGKSKGGKDLPPGAYFYYIDLKNSAHPNPYRGSLNLVR